MRNIKKIISLALSIAVFTMVLSFGVIAQTPSGVAEVRWAAGERTAAYFVSGGGGTVITSPYGFTATENGFFTIFARDVAGNSSVRVIEVTTIDTTAPSVTLTPSTTAPTNQDVVVTVTATDNLSGIAEIRVVETGEVLSYPYQFMATENGVFTVVVTDNAGNTTTETITISNIDRLAPTITANWSDEWTNGAVTVNIEVVDN